MRIPFFQPKADAPIRVPLPELSIGFGIYFYLNGRSEPEPDELASMITAWMEAHAAYPLRAAIRECMDQGLLKLDVRDKSFMPTPPLEFLRYMAPGEEEMQRFQQATPLVLLSLPDQVGPPFIGLWGAVAAARAVAKGLDGVIFDPEVLRLLPIASHTEPLPAEGRVKIPEQIMVPFSVDRRGLGWMTTKGMRKFGLPELEIRDVPPDLQGALCGVANGIARFLVAEVSRLVESGGAPPRELQLPSEIRNSLHDLAAGEGDGAPEPPEGVRGWTMLRLQYRPGRFGASSFLVLRPPRSFRGDQGVWLNSLFIWIVVNTWTGDSLWGQLANDPQLRRDLRAGQTVELYKTDIFDWILSLPDGSQEGGYTIAVVEREGRRRKD
jgi:hypothetical protein